MQVSKFVLAVCATTVCAGILCVQAQDTPAQAAARAALMQSMGEPATAAPAAPVTPAAPAKDAPILVESSGFVTEQTNAPAQTNQVATPPPVPAVVAPMAQTPVTSPSSSDNEAQARARAALLQAMGQQPAETPAPAPAPVPAMAVTPAPTVAVAPAESAPAETTPMKSAAPDVKPVAAAPASASNTNYPGKNLGFAPIVAPPLPISATKAQQLDALLTQYKADQISPVDYQKQRAAILAEP